MPIRYIGSTRKLFPPVQILGRFLLSQIFLISGFAKLLHWHQTEAFMASAGMRGVPFFLSAAILAELLGGLSILLGYRARAGALMLFLYLIPVTCVFHAFWRDDSLAFQMQLTSFLKNLAISGGLLEIVLSGAGAWSLDARHWKIVRERRVGGPIRGSLQRVS